MAGEIPPSLGNPLPPSIGSPQLRSNNSEERNNSLDSTVNAGASTSRPVSTASQAVEEQDVDDPDIIPETPEKVTRAASYEHYAMSPFKSYFKISPSVLIDRKRPDMDRKLPLAISGKVCNDLLEQKQQEKLDELNRKEENKKKRIARQEQKKNSKKAKNNKELADNEIVYADSSDEGGEAENVCEACLGDENLNIDTAWIGCNQCKRWYHRSCLSEEIESMSEEQIEDLDYVCDICQKQNAKKTTRRTLKFK